MFGFGKKKPDPTTAQTLSDITRGMQYSVNAVQEILEQTYIRMLSRYFDESNNNEARTVTLKVSPNQEIEVPLIAIVQPNSLALQEMTVEMSIRIDDTTLKTGRPGPMLKADQTGTNEPSPSLNRTSFTVSIAPTGKPDAPRKGDVISVVMKFKAGDPPEGISRIIDEFTSKVLSRPVKADETKKDDTET